MPLPVAVLTGLALLLVSVVLLRFGWRPPARRASRRERPPGPAPMWLLTHEPEPLHPARSTPTEPRREAA